MIEAIFKKLAAIGINLLHGGGDSGVNVKVKGRKITGIRLSTLFKDLIHVETNIDNRTIVVLNPAKMKGKQRRALQALLPDLLDDVGAIMDEKSIATVESAAESLPNIHDIAKKFIPLIPASDVPLLNACIFLRLKFERGEGVEIMKGQIMKVYGTRGCNFANLCSAGYLESEFLPYHAQLMKLYPDNPAEVQVRFHAFYKTVLNELPWTEFVSGRMSPEKRTAHIVEKMKRNVINGVRYLNIHALGARNVQTVLDILPEIQAETGAQTVHLENVKERMFVRLEIPPQISK